MAEPESATSRRTTSEISESLAEFVIPTPLKFLISNIKTLVPTQLSTENYSIWRLQLHQHFTANGFGDHLTGVTVCPPASNKKEHSLWTLIDRNLISALFSTISPSVLPYVLTLKTAHDIWITLEKRLQPTNRSRVIQLKNELHQIQMKDRTMNQYLDQVKNLVDNIAAAGSQVDTEDIIMYILNGLPAMYNSFKTAIRTSLNPISLDILYSLLCSEEINLQHQRSQEINPQSETVALFSARSTANRGRFNKWRGKPNFTRNTSLTDHTQTVNTQGIRPSCQICGKNGHTALNCWHRCNLQYAPPSNPKALTVQQQSASTGDWILDSGASSHLTPDTANFQQSNPYNGLESVSIANGSNLQIQNSGNGLLPLPESHRKLKLSNMLHVPELAHNLLSISKLTSDNNVSVSFDSNGFSIKDCRDNRTLLRGPTRHGLYQVRPISNNKITALQAASNLHFRWHSRLGHPCARTLQLLSREIPDIPRTASHSSACVSCNVSKSHKLSFPTSSSVCNKKFQLVHSDVWGPAPVSSLNGFSYYVIFIDEFSKFSWLYLLKSKDETFSKFQQFHNLIKTEFNTTIQNFRSDGGGEFTSTEFRTYLQNNGIKHQVSCPYTPKQNGTAERKHRHLLESIRTLLHAASLPPHFWAEAASTSNYLINRIPSTTIGNQTPYLRLHGKAASYSHLRIFGCLCFPWTRPQSPNKLSPRSQECILVGYSSQHKGYRCFHPPTKRIIISRHVVFYEDQFPYRTNTISAQNKPAQTTNNPLLLIPTSTVSHSHSIPTYDNSPTIQELTGQNMEISSSPRSQTSVLPTNAPTQVQGHPMITRLRSGISKPKQIFDLSVTTKATETPTSYSQASKSEHWRKAMSEEFLALQQNATWSLVPPPPGKPILGCKWTFKTKLAPNGQVDRFKARLVAQGCSQEFGVNYTETFSPVAKMVTIRVFLTVAIQNQWPVTQLDISNAFLHGKLEDEVFMKQPTGFIDSQQPNHVCKLHRSIYGLKQSPRQWFNRFTSYLQTVGFGFSKADPSLLIYNRNNIRSFILVYVDDILVTGNNPDHTRDVLRKLQQEFRLKQLGDVSLFLGIQVTKANNNYFLHQEHYARDLLNMAGFQDCKPSDTPLGLKPRIQPDDQPYSDPTHFRKLAGSLQYLSITRPDIAFATNNICQHMHSPRNRDYKDLKRLLRYVKATLAFGLPISTGDSTLRVYTDADWASDQADRKSVSGFCIFLGSTLISWHAKKQATVAKSSTEAEYRSLSSATSDTIWLRRLLAEFQLSQFKPTPIYCDNTSAIAIAHNPVFHARTKHIEIDYHFISDHIKHGDIQLHHISSEDQIADIFTKPLSTKRFNTLRSKLTIRPNE
ncbi:Retrovirus-related Pol polyprotein from transposon TNT 1-94 [Dendrobium catenatum]|uniref:Retrovirus-related Pol polyprotein from transposon TNT 1-94 n=1 Tax=Dendrobium catenatum TaxID=906689 RepID=A0A2I0VXM7_9ASPA|nr:Retrovirus-related Pol polyprotein from transposon TNT 1-94 [Dendrobium catenatum]